MTDKELIELAARAYVDKCWHDNVAYMQSFLSKWNPITDDGDALRLAVNLGIDIEWQHDSGYVKVYRTKMLGVWSGYVTELFCVGDAMKATRRAITSAAAQIGRGME